MTAKKTTKRKPSPKPKVATKKKVAAKKKVPSKTKTVKPAATKKKVSRQREWQIRMREEGRRINCGEPALGKATCPKHLIAERERQRKIHGYKGRKKGSLSYVFEK